MTDVKQLLIDTLETAYGYPVYLQGSFSDDDQYPSDFWTYWNDDTEDYMYYDNQERHTLWYMDLNFYSNNAKRVNTQLREAIPVLRAAGFQTSTKGHDVLSDEPTHTGRGIQLIYSD